MKSNIILKKYCRQIMLIGCGNFWYEEGVIGDDNTFRYRMYNYILLSTYVFMTLLEILGALIGDFPDDEKNDCIAFSVSHLVVMIKMYSVFTKKPLIKQFNRDMARICGHYETDDRMNEAKYKAIKWNFIGYFVVVYGSVVFYVLEGLRKMYNGSHFVTIVTYYPTFQDNSTLATSMRLFMTVVLMLMMLSMIVSVDCFTMMYLIMFKYKIITLRNYFENLRREFDRISETGDVTVASERLVKGLIEGVVIHAELLRMSKVIDKAFGTVMALQVCQSSGTAVALLLQLATSDNLTFVASMKIIFFIVALFFLLALFLCNAGEITFQASLLGDSIFYSGWHVCSVRSPQQRNLRWLVLQACMQAQRPLVMKAFKMLELTYASFLQVVRTTYSVFALFYAQKK